MCLYLTFCTFHGCVLVNFFNKKRSLARALQMPQILFFVLNYILQQENRAVLGASTIKYEVYYLAILKSSDYLLYIIH